MKATFLYETYMGDKLTGGNSLDSSSLIMGPASVVFSLASDGIWTRSFGFFAPPMGLRTGEVAPAVVPGGVEFMTDDPSVMGDLSPFMGDCPPFIPL